MPNLKKMPGRLPDDNHAFQMWMAVSQGEAKHRALVFSLSRSEAASTKFVVSSDEIGPLASTSMDPPTPSQKLKS